MFDKDGIPSHPTLQPGERQLYLNTHDKSTFKANDRKKSQWIHKSDDCKPQPKDEGASIMVSDFLCPDYGCLVHGEMSVYFLYSVATLADMHGTSCSQGSACHIQSRQEP